MVSTSSTPKGKQLEAGVFSSVDDARRAVQALLDRGFHEKHVTVVCSDKTRERYFSNFEHQEPAGTFTPAAAAAGSAVGAILGGLTVFAVAAATGGVALWAAGPITAWAGGVAGGLIGAMMTRGVEKELANFYQQAVVNGQILIGVEESNDLPSPPLSQAAEVLAQNGAHTMPLREG